MRWKLEDTFLVTFHLPKDISKLISATTAPVTLGQTDWSDDESDDESKLESNNDGVTYAEQGLVIANSF